jgi:uncharacterized membrane protein YbhN (UPF0104 family)
MTQRVQEHRRILATSLVIGIAAVALLLNRQLIGTAASEIRQLPAQVVVVLLLVIVVHRLLQSLFVVMVTASSGRTNGEQGGLGIRNAITVNEAHTGCSLAIVGGGAVGTGVKVAMLNSWGIRSGEIAASVAATSVIPLITQWAVTAAAGLYFILHGDRSLANQAAVLAGVVLSVGPLLFWVTLIRKPVIVQWAAHKLQPAAHWLSSSRVLPMRFRRHLEHTDLAHSAESIRAAAMPLLGRRGVAAFALALLSNLAMGTILIVSLHGLEVLGDYKLYPMQVIAGLALARTLGSFAPLPGGLGVMDAGLLASLTGHGVQRSSAVAAIAMYRASTFLVPIVTGCVAILWWRVSSKRGSIEWRACESEGSGPC